MPISFWGFLTYGLLAAVAWNRYADNQWRWAWVISLFGLLFSLYLTAIAFFELKAACPYCLTSLGLMAVIFIMTTLQKPKNLPNFAWGPWLGKSVGVGAAVIVALHLVFRRLLGQRPRSRRPLGQRAGGALDENRCQVLRRFLVSTL